MKNRFESVVLLLGCLLVGVVHAAEEWKPIPMKIPPKGVEIPAADREALQQQLMQLDARIDQIQPGHPQYDLKPDIEIYAKAVRWALRFNEFYKKDQAKVGFWALAEASQRLDTLSTHPWTTQQGLVVRGYRSRIDGSVQPYGVEIPEGADPKKTYVFLHGRGDKTTDLHFIDQRANKPGKIAPEGAIILHPFGRHCMGFKSAGEIDVLDVVAHAAKAYGTSRTPVLMGFSMGGAGVWHIGAHYPGRWSAVAPGAGFAETKRYIKLKQEDYPPAYEQALWGIYDVPNYVRNLFNHPLVAYSGEIDKQKQAADVMAEAFAAAGKTMTHLIGPDTAHKYHPDTLKMLLGKLDQTHVDLTNPKNWPDEVHLQTQTLRYNRVYWVAIEQLDAHWQDSRVDAVYKDGVITATTKNVSALRFLRDDWQEAVVDGFRFKQLGGVTMLRSGDRWIPARDKPTIQKLPGLQGPIDDAFLSPFFVGDNEGKSAHAGIQRWIDFEQAHFLRRWASLYRGQVPMAPTEEGLDRNLVLWGTPGSNRVIKRIMPELPIQWDAQAIRVGGKTYDAAHHVLMMIYPNPLNPERYVVINSGPTHREGHDRTNSLQNPKLPDWAVIDVREPPSDVAPGKVVAAGFFDERWQLKE